VLVGPPVEEPRVPNNRPPALSNVADPVVGADSRLAIWAAFQHRGVELCPRCSSAVPCTRTTRSRQPHTGRGNAKSAHSRACVSIAVMDKGANGTRSTLVEGSLRSDNSDK
jgi:hypothetical protein